MEKSIDDERRIDQEEPPFSLQFCSPFAHFQYHFTGGISHEAHI